MKKFVMAAFAAGLIYSTIPAFADDAVVSSTANATVAAQAPGIGVDVSAAGKTSDEHRAFQAKLSADQQTTVKTNCKLPDKNRTPAEQAYCADLN